MVSAISRVACDVRRSGKRASQAMRPNLLVGDLPAVVDFDAGNLHAAPSLRPSPAARCGAASRRRRRARALEEHRHQVAVVALAGGKCLGDRSRAVQNVLPSVEPAKLSSGLGDSANAYTRQAEIGASTRYSIAAPGASTMRWESSCVRRTLSVVERHVARVAGQASLRSRHSSTSVRCVARDGADHVRGRGLRRPSCGRSRDNRRPVRARPNRR